MTTGDSPRGYQFYLMPDGSFVREVASAANAWTIEIVREVRQMNERLARIEKALEFLDNRGD
jgi:hypothetical protein